MKRFPLEKRFKEALSIAGISVDEVIKKAKLKESLFNEENPVVTAEEYFHFMETVGEYAIPEEMIIKLTTNDHMEMFSPPVFAAFCSEDGIKFLHRMADYEALFCAVEFIITSEDDKLTLELQSVHHNMHLPKMIVILKYLYLIFLLRKATGQPISPIEIMSEFDLTSTEYQEYFNTKITKGASNQLTFRRSDLELPFLSANESMWSYFEPELKRRLLDTEVDESFAAEVREIIVDSLPSYDFGIATVASKLGISARTLQRKLQVEGTSFQQQLNHTRELMAKTYLSNMKLSIEDITYLLGYQDVSSFQRAFNIWTGMNLSEYRKKAKEY